MSLATDSLSRIKASVRSVYGLANLDEWISRHTLLSGKPYSFTNYEYQIPIIRDPSRKSIIVKPAQVGLSELAYRWAVASCCVVDDFTCIYVFPSSSDAERNCKTRINPMIVESPELRRLIDPAMDNSELKKFSRNSFLMFRGTMSATAPLSTPANAIILDEVDKCDMDVATTYVSRLQNREHKIQKMFSTPTVAKFGISREAETATRMKHLATCNHCNHTFLPSYFDHVKIPGWDKSLEEVTRQNINTIRWKEAQLLCPNCGKDPDLHHTRMEFVAENANEGHEATAWFVNPFSAHNIIKPSYLIQVGTQFNKYSEFRNQALGEVAEEKNEQLNLADIVQAEMQNLHSSDFNVMGGDMGVLCHICIGRIANDGTFIVVHREAVHYTNFEERTRRLTIEYRVRLSVFDSQPYTDLITRVSKSRQNTWGAIFTNSKTPLAFTLQKEPEDLSEGKMDLKLVKVNRTASMDSMVAVIKEGKFAINSSDQNEMYRQHMLSMKRVQKFTKDGELVYVWEKTDSIDHYFFATLYLWIATQMAGTIGGRGAVASNIPLVARIKAPVY